MGLFSKIGDFLGDALPAVGTIVGTAFGGPAGGAIGGSLGSIGSGLLGDSDTAVKGLNSSAGQSQGLAQLQMEQEFNAAEAQKNRDFQLEMWNKNNEYNSPAAQLERLKQAGINPNAMFGSSGYSPVASSDPSGATGAGSPSIANSLLLQDAQLANLMAQAQKTKSDADLNKLQLTYDQLTFGQRAKALELANDETKQRINNLIQDKDIQRKTFDIFALKSSAELKTMREQLNVLRSQYLSNMKSIEKTDQDIRESEARVNLIGEQTESQDIQNQLKTIELDFCKITGVPLGTPVEEKLFSLYKEGKFDDVLLTYMISSEIAYSKSWMAQGNTLLRGAADEITKLVEDIKQDASTTFTSPFWQEVKKGSKKAIAEYIRSSPYARTNNRGRVIYNP